MFPNYSPPFFEQIYLEEMPSEWRWVDITNISKPKQWETISQSSFTDNGYPVYGANGKVGFYSNYNHEDSVIAISCRGACGDLHLTEPFSYVSGNAMCLDDLSEDIEQKFLFYALSYRGLKDTISGSAQPQITRENLKGVFFPLPPLPEQKKIASILTSVDEVIEKTQSQIDKLQDLKKGTMNELLTKGIGHTEFKDSELGRIPKSWDLARLDDLVSAPICYGIVQVGEFVPNGVPVIAIKNLGSISLSNLNRTSTTIESRYERSRVKPDDLLISIKGTIGRLDVVPTDFAGNISRDIARLRFSEKMLSEFCLGFLESSNGKRLIERTSVGTTRAELSIHRIKEMSIPVPPITEQYEIISVSKSLSDKIWASENYLTKIQSLKKSLMQDLLTGKVRVSVN